MPDNAARNARPTEAAAGLTVRSVHRLISSLEAAAASVEDDDDRFARGYAAGVALAVTALRERLEDQA